MAKEPRESAVAHDYPPVLVLDPHGHSKALRGGAWEPMARSTSVTWFCLRQAEDHLVEVRVQLESSLGRGVPCVLVAGHGLARTAVQAAAPRAGHVHTVLTESTNPTPHGDLAAVLRSHGTTVTAMPAPSGDDERGLTRPAVVDAVLHTLASASGSRAPESVDARSAC